MFMVYVAIAVSAFIAWNALMIRFAKQVNFPIYVTLGYISLATLPTGSLVYLFLPYEVVACLFGSCLFCFTIFLFMEIISTTMDNLRYEGNFKKHGFLGWRMRRGPYGMMAITPHFVAFSPSNQFRKRYWWISGKADLDVEIFFDINEGGDIRRKGSWKWRVTLNASVERASPWKFQQAVQRIKILLQDQSRIVRRHQDDNREETLAVIEQIVRAIMGDHTVIHDEEVFPLEK